MSGTIEAIDRDKEARRHLWRGLQRMGPRERVAYLRSLCGEAKPGEVGVKVTTHSGTTGEAYQDVMALGYVYGRDIYAACEHLEKWLKRRR